MQKTIQLERELVDVLSIEEVDFNLLRQEKRLERFLQRKLKSQGFIRKSIHFSVGDKGEIQGQAKPRSHRRGFSEVSKRSRGASLAISAKTQSKHSDKINKTQLLSVSLDSESQSLSRTSCKSSLKPSTHSRGAQSIFKSSSKRLRPYNKSKVTFSQEEPTVSGGE